MGRFHTYHWVILINLLLSLSFHTAVWALLAHEPKPVAVSGGVISVKIGDAADYMKSQSTGLEAQEEIKKEEKSPPKPKKQREVVQSPAPIKEEQIRSIPKPITSKPKLKPKPIPAVEPIPAAIIPIQTHNIQPVQAPVKYTSAPRNTSNVLTPSNIDASQSNLESSTRSSPSHFAKQPSSATQNNVGKSTAASLPGNPDIPISEDVSAQYSALVTRHLQRRKKPKASQPGAVFVSFQLNRDGTIKTIKVSKSSGSSRFDRDALRYVKRASPFPKPPKSAKLHFNIRVRGS